MNNYLKGFSLAVSMLSIFPFFKVHNFTKGINGYAVMFYPVVGFLLGSLLYGIYLILPSTLPSFHIGIIIFCIWVLITGGLHLDGFSDTIDGLFVPKKEALKVMKDPNIGGMGMIFSVTFLILKASSLATFNAFYLLPVILMFSRFNAVLAIYFFKYITPNGMGSLAKKELQTKYIIIIFLFVLLLSIPYFLLFLINLFIFFIMIKLFLKRYGGLSGDIYGFIIEISEVIMLNIVLVGLV